MGHIYLRNFPGTPNWQRVARFIAESAEVPDVAATTLQAAQNGLKRAKNDPTIAHAIYLLIQLGGASQKTQISEYLQQLRNVGVHVSDPASIFGLTSAYLDALDKFNRSLSHRSDIGEMGQMAATEGLTAFLRSKTEGLFGQSPEIVRSALSELATERGFALFQREFTGRFLRSFINYFLSIELSNHVGGDKRFASIQEHIGFKKALELHCNQVSAIIEDYAGGWYSKKKREGVPITPEAAKAFWSYGLQKVQNYMSRGNGV